MKRFLTSLLLRIVECRMNGRIVKCLAFVLKINRLDASSTEYFPHECEQPHSAAARDWSIQQVGLMLVKSRISMPFAHCKKKSNSVGSFKCPYFHRTQILFEPSSPCSVFVMSNVQFL